jgi:hypothetical protein
METVYRDRLINLISWARDARQLRDRYPTVYEHLPGNVKHGLNAAQRKHFSVFFLKYMGCGKHIKEGVNDPYYSIDPYVLLLGMMQLEHVRLERRSADAGVHTPGAPQVILEIPYLPPVPLGERLSCAYLKAGGAFRLERKDDSTDAPVRSLACIIICNNCSWPILFPSLWLSYGCLATVLCLIFIFVWSHVSFILVLFWSSFR